MATPRSTKAIAQHEAGHAVAAIVCGVYLVSVDIQPQQLPGGGIGIAGADFHFPPDNTILGRGENVVLPLLVTICAGWLAEKLVNAKAFMETGHPSADGDVLYRYATGAVCIPVRRDGKIVLPSEEREKNKSRINSLIDTAEQEAAKLVHKYKRTIGVVARELLKRRFITGITVRQIVLAN